MKSVRDRPEADAGGITTAIAEVKIVIPPGQPSSSTVPQDEQVV